MAIDSVADAPISQRRRTMAGPYPAIGFVGALLVAVTAPTWRLAFIGTHEPWRLTLPFVPFNGTRPFTAIAFVIGATALGVAWLGLIGRVQRSKAPERDRMRVVIGTALLWFVPVMLGPPLLSSDIYSYAAEGDMITKGHDPTTEGMFKLHYGYISHVDPVWRVPYGGNPYGPVQMGIAAGAVYATGHTWELTIWLLRFISLGAVLLSVWAITDIARRHGVSPPVAVAIGIANPIAVLHLVGGGHNDAILMALLCTGFAVAQRGRFWLGVVLIALATAVKLPAAAALVYLGWCRPGVGAAVKDRLKVIAQAFAVTAGIIVTACAVVGVGLSGWILAMRNTGTTTGTLSLPTRLGFVVSGMFHEAGLPSSDQIWVGILRLGGLALAGYVCVRLLGLVERIGPVAATGLCLLAVMLLGPVVWPWYLAPAFALLGATQLGRWRASVLVLCALFAAEVFPIGVKSKPVLEGSHLVSLVLIVAIATVSFAAPLVVDRWHALADADSGSVVGS